MRCNLATKIINFVKYLIMSKGKKGNPNKAQADLTGWDEGLVNEIAEDVSKPS